MAIFPSIINLTSYVMLEKATKRNIANLTRASRAFLLLGLFRLFNGLHGSKLHI